MNEPLPPSIEVAKRDSAVAIILAAGTGSRARTSASAASEMEANAPAKQFTDLQGKPLLSYSLQALSQHRLILTLLLVLPSNETDLEIAATYWKHHVAEGTQLLLVRGGESRRHSTLNALEFWTAHKSYAAELPVLVHDGARPFVSEKLIDRVLAGLDHAPGAIPALPVTDTLKTKDDGLLTKGPDRDATLRVQTPQGFHGAALIDAHRRANAQAEGEAFTDDASIMEWAGYGCVAVDGSADNIKITVPEDWAHARAIMAYAGETESMQQRYETRTGLGYDVHRLVPGDGVWLCGHFIEHSHRLDGHSDADVGLHALTDALLGAIGAGDIGTHFPPAELEWKGAASHIFLSHAVDLMAKAGGRIVNVDITIVAERPKVGPHRDAIVERLSELLKVDHTRISIKATTNEKMGFAGREEGIAAMATASVELPYDD